MTSRHSALAVFVLVVLAAAPVAAAELVIVEMTTVNFEPRFVPNEITVEPGDTVRWVNVDPFLLDHAVASGTGSADPLAGTLWDSGTLRVNEFFEFTFDTTGDFEYFSRPHEFEGMFGLVHVNTSLDVPEVEAATWGKVKALFNDILPRDPQDD